MTDDVSTRGALVGGRFEIRELIASGGEADVYLARDLELDLDVVLKTRLIGGDDDLGRLRREAALLMRIVAHSGLPTVRSDLVDGSRYYMVSDYVDGNDLRTIVNAQSEGGLQVASVLRLVDQIAITLDHLHGHRPAVIHGDLKPENVIVTDDGRAVIVDFGAAMRVGDDRERLGTPGFSAPEMLAGEALTSAADIYSLAAVAAHLLTGIVPRLGAPWPQALADAGLARMERVLRGGLTWDPLGRPRTATEFAQRLREAAEMDVPTGTVTMLVVGHGTTDDRPGSRSPITLLEAAGGHEVTSITVPETHSVVVFSRAGDAAVAALDLAGNERRSIALHAGDLGGWHGATLQQLAAETLELYERAPPSSVVCSPPVSMLLGSDRTLRFDPVDGRCLRLRRAHDDAADERRDTGTRAAGAPTTDRVPGWVAMHRSHPMAGRVAELSAGEAAIDRGRKEQRASLVVVVGDAGMGKTRYLAELAGRAADAGDLVLVGRCSESGGAFEPLLDALGDDLFPFEQGQLERDEEGWVDRRRFFGRITSAVAALGRPVVLVLDDVQWIDGSSLALLDQLLDDIGRSLVVLAGCRPGDESGVLDELTRRPGTTVVSMRPLARSDIFELAAQSGLSLGDATVDGLVALTGGSPFHGLQLLGHLRDVPGHELGSAHLTLGVREWIMHRVDRLGVGARAVLAPAAVFGTGFEVVALADVLGISPLEAITQLDAASAAGLLVDGAFAGEFHFVHAIVRTSLAESLSASRQALLHAAIAGRIEEQGDDMETLEAALHHWLEAGHLGDPLHAGDLAARVATVATERLAHERAISLLDRALEALSGAAASAERDRVEGRLRVAHGRADVIALRHDLAIEQLYLAADLADHADDPATLAEAALVASLNRRHGLEDPDLLRLLERASERCPPEPAVLPAMLHVRRSRLLPAGVRHEERAAMARRGLIDLDSMDPVDRATVESEVARACWNPDDAPERLALTTRQIDEAMRHTSSGPSRWTGVLIEALNHRWAARMQLGDVAGALDDADHAARVADEAGTSFLLSRVMMGQAMIHTTLGDHDRAERLSHDALAMSDRHNLRLVQLAIAYSIGRDRGQQAELARLERQMGDLVDNNPMYVSAFALVHAEAGQLDDARRLLRMLDDLAPWPRNWLWLATTVAALETSILADEHDMTRRYAAVLGRYSGQWAMAAAELSCWGPIDRVLGLAHLAGGRLDRARELLDAAHESATAQRAEPWIVRCEAGLAALGARSA